MRRLKQSPVFAVEQMVVQPPTIAFTNTGQVVDWEKDGGTIKPGTQLTPVQRDIVSRISKTSTRYGGKKSIRFYNRGHTVMLPDGTTVEL
jgi:hypothetical protein